MENFFIDDEFCSSLEDVFYKMDFDEKHLELIPEDWSLKIYLTDLEPMFFVDAEEMEEWLSDRNEERFPEDDNQSAKITKALKECIDFEKLNSMIPKLYYANGKSATITKKDLVEYAK